MTDSLRTASGGFSSREEFADLTVTAIQAHDRPQWVADRLAETLAVGSARFENTHRHKDGTTRDVIVDGPDGATLLKQADRPGAAAVVEATVALARAMGLECLAEGVETEAELQWLAAAGCRTFQGFWFARPCRAEEFAERWLTPVDEPRG